MDLTHLLKDKDLSRSWEEDFTNENGNYINICTYCKCEFLGHKRRVVCKVCANPKIINVELKIAPLWKRFLRIPSIWFQLRKLDPKSTYRHTWLMFIITLNGVLKKYKK